MSDIEKKDITEENVVEENVESVKQTPKVEPKKTPVKIEDDGVESIVKKELLKKQVESLINDKADSIIEEAFKDVRDIAPEAEINRTIKQLKQVLVGESLNDGTLLLDNEKIKSFVQASAVNVQASQFKKIKENGNTPIVKDLIRQSVDQVKENFKDPTYLEKILSGTNEGALEQIKKAGVIDQPSMNKSVTSATPSTEAEQSTVTTKQANKTQSTYEEIKKEIIEEARKNGKTLSPTQLFGKINERFKKGSN